MLLVLTSYFCLLLSYCIRLFSICVHFKYIQVHTPLFFFTYKYIFKCNNLHQDITYTVIIENMASYGVYKNIYICYCFTKKKKKLYMHTFLMRLSFAVLLINLLSVAMCNTYECAVHKCTKIAYFCIILYTICTYWRLQIFWILLGFCYIIYMLLWKDNSSLYESRT